MAQPANTSKRTIFLSATLAIVAFAAQRAEAYPATPGNTLAISAPSVTRIDNRNYRHCHNKQVHVVCYTSMPGEPEAKAPHERHLGRKSPRERDLLDEHRHLGHGEWLWRD
jgi:hypothetical protein